MSRLLATLIYSWSTHFPKIIYIFCKVEHEMLLKIPIHNWIKSMCIQIMNWGFRQVICYLNLISSSNLKCKSKNITQKLSPIPIFIDLGINKSNKHTRLLQKFFCYHNSCRYSSIKLDWVGTLSSKFSIFRKTIIRTINENGKPCQQK